MIEPKIETLIGSADSKYTLVILAAKRSRQINSSTAVSTSSLTTMWS